MASSIEAIRKEFEIPLSIEDAFDLFTAGFSKWWPKEYSWSKDEMTTISIECRDGGRCTEIGPNNFQMDWGRVLNWNPPGSFAISWQISPNRVPQPSPRESSKIELEFKAINDQSTMVSFEHSGIENHGDGAQEYRDALNSDYGWHYILNKYINEAIA